MHDDNITILIKLFDTLKESSNRNEESTQKLIMQQLELVGQIKNLPVDDLKQALKEHAKDSADNIDNCSGIIELKTADIMDMLRTVINKLNKIMLIAIVVASVLSGGYFIVRTVTESQQNKVYITDEQTQILLDSIKQQLEDHIKTDTPTEQTKE